MELYYQVLNSFTLPQFNKFWTTDLEGIPKHKPKAQNTLNKKSEIAGQSSNSNQPKKKDKKSSTKIAKDDNQSKNLNSQKKAKKSLKKYSAFLVAEFFLLFILLYKPLALEGLAPVFPYFYPVRMGIFRVLCHQAGCGHVVSSMALPPQPVT
ncbi:hypothetical protein RhiirC2_718030 [Rhizophagus irregularis]|uniref:Uncharacterized protein n=1 Tax=Rhizophagus irregularis TaxID=588596 RepID=A0A2N1MK32_9GLOM|nr:hypothetical protein RhiirC2_718030 [Rhizophagus irregularis]